MCFLAFYTEIHDGHQEWRKNDFWQKLPNDFYVASGLKIWSKSLLSHTASKVNAFMHFRHKVKMVTKTGGRTVYLNMGK